MSWSELRTGALVGTARRPPAGTIRVGGVEVGAGLSDEERVLAGAVLGGAARRAGWRPGAAVPVPDPAPPETVPAAPAAVVQLLDLVLSGAVIGGIHADLLVGHWLERCAHAHRRLPHRLVVPVLERATANLALREWAAVVLGGRGRWLGAQRGEWSWAAAAPGDPTGRTAAVDLDAWSLLPADQRLATLERIRRDDAGAARALLTSTWSTDPAAVRAAHLGVLATGLGPADEELLEAALDDRARSVQKLAAELLDGLPSSARAGRMAGRLRPLLHVEGRWRKRALSVALPDDPDAAAVRDGLGEPPSGWSRRGWWLEQLVAGAPLAIWTDLTGADPARTLAMVTDDDARRGLVRAAVAERHSGWAQALFAVLRRPSILDAVEPGQREGLVAEHLPAIDNAWALAATLERVPAPWSAAFSGAVVRHLHGQKQATHLVESCRDVLAAGLHPDTAALLQKWLDGAADQPPLTRVLRAVLQVQSLRRSINEAFA